MLTKYQPVRAEEILSPSHLENLSPAAIRLYAAAWNKMSFRQVTQIWMDDTEASIRSRVPLEVLRSAQSELARSGLLLLISGETKTWYEFIEDPDTNKI